MLDHLILFDQLHLRKHSRKQWIQQVGERHSFGFYMIFNEFNIQYIHQSETTSTNSAKPLLKLRSCCVTIRFSNKFVATLGHALTPFSTTQHKSGVYCGSPSLCMYLTKCSPLAIFFSIRITEKYPSTIHNTSLHYIELTR